MNWEVDAQDYGYVCQRVLCICVSTCARFNPERLEKLGPDLATAHFVVARHGAVKFEGSARWISTSKDLSDNKQQNLLPVMPTKDLCLEAVDVSDTDMMYISFDNFGKESRQMC